MKDSILLTKSKAFALRTVRLYKHLRERKESVITKQMLRSGTAISVWRAIRAMKEVGLLVREGADKGGKWIVKK